MIKAIETVYKGYRFRSRLEARWAVFFDAVGLEWEYERQGYYLGGPLYLPDFFIKNLAGRPAIIEIKPELPSLDSDDFKKVYLLAKELQDSWVYILVGSPDPEKPIAIYGITKTRDNEPKYIPCFLIPIIVDRQIEVAVSSPIYDFTDAKRKARSARFEHGEHGYA